MGLWGCICMSKLISLEIKQAEVSLHISKLPLSSKGKIYIDISEEIRRLRLAFSTSLHV